MYTQTALRCFDSAHILSEYTEKEKKLHGHHFTVTVTALCARAHGSELEESLDKIVDFLDHAFIYRKNSIRDITAAVLIDEGFRLVETDFEPDARGLSRYIFKRLAGAGLMVSEVTVSDTEKTSATYKEEVL